MKAKKFEWSRSPDWLSKYCVAKAGAQKAADEDGFDRGLESNELFRSFRFFMLPQKQNRCGHELRCEVVMCSSDERMQKGHGRK
jgi:hypothetical protein